MKPMRSNLCLLQNVRKQFLQLRKLSFSSPSFAAAYVSPMSDSYYNEEQKEIQRTFSKIIETDINPFVEDWEQKQQFPSHQVFKKLGDAGLLGIDKPEKYGGLGLNFKYVAAILEELGTVQCGGVRDGVSVHMTMTQTALTRFGSEELKQKFLVPSIAGDYVSCVAVSEPSAGSDVANIKMGPIGRVFMDVDYKLVTGTGWTAAIKKGDDLVINGQKMWITNGFKADWTCLLANTSSGASHKNKSLICVPLNSKGISRTKINKLGTHSSDTAQIFFDDVRVPITNIIGDEGAGFQYQMLQFQQERLTISLYLLKALDSVISSTIEYTQQRQAFGKSVLDNQVVHFRLAELATEVEALRALVYKATDMFVAGDDVTRFASMAKLKVGRLCRIVGDSCLQYWGGMGYTREASVSRFYRDTKVVSIAGGADEVMLQIICKLMNIFPKRNK